LLPHWFKPTNKPRTDPKLDAMPINEALRTLDCRRIVGTNNRFESIEMSVAPDEVSSILFHPKAPLRMSHIDEPEKQTLPDS
jgi:hypothetical protein